MTPTQLSPDEHERVSALFEQARDVPVEERERMVRAAADYSPAVRAEVISLLAHLPSAGFLDASAAPPGVVDRVLREAAVDDPRRVVGARLGPFEVGPLLGAGGMGAVYRALDTRSGRQVALKLLRMHSLSRSGGARLEREARVLERLQHPCIARVLDAGSFELPGVSAGTPYVSMELLEGGLPVTAWAVANRVDARAILSLAARIADAVHHAHQRGVIHRDLKPQNILVLPDGTPKLIDFGIAVATDADVSRVTFSTSVGTLVGTFAYMSPEQCEGDPVAIDIRTDIYTLGVVLYELLAGERPHDLSGRPLPEVLAAIRQGRVRRLESLRPDLAGDVATIVHKAMDPVADHRYASAADLAQDIERYLSDRPIEARAAGVLDHLRLLWRRHRLAVSATTASAACIVVLGLASLGFAIRAKAEEQRALTSLGLEEAARRRAERMTTFLRGAFGSANPYQPREINPALLSSAADPWAEWMFNPWTFAGVDGRKATVEDVLNGAARRLPGEFADDARARADLAETLGVTLYRLEAFEQARVLLEQCMDVRAAELGEQHEETIRAMLRLAAVFDTLDGRRAKELYTRAHLACVERFGERDARTLRAQRMLANAIESNGGDASPELYRITPPPPPGGPPIPPAELFNVASGAWYCVMHGHPGAREVVEDVMLRLGRGDSDSDPLTRVHTLRIGVTAMLDLGTDAGLLRPQISRLHDEAAAAFGAWSPEYINMLSGVMYCQRPGLDPAESAVFFANAVRAQLRLRGWPHWEVGKALVAARDAAGMLTPQSPGARDAALDLQNASEGFPQGLTSVGAIADSLLSRIDTADGNAAAGLARSDAMLLRMRAPQAPALQPHAWAAVLTARGRCLVAMGRRDEARVALHEALETAPRFSNTHEADVWLKVARDELAALGG